MRPYHGALALWLATAVVTGLPAAPRAQVEDLRASTPRERARWQTAFMRSTLGLTGEQASKVAAINLKYAEKMQPLIEDREARLEKLGRAREIYRAKETELQAVLSREQFERYVASRAEMRERVEEAIERRLERGE